MGVRVKLSEVPPGLCYQTKGSARKKLSDGRIASVGKDRRVRIGAPSARKDPEVTIVPCPLRYFGVGLRMNPEKVVEIGSAKPPKTKRGCR